MANLLRLRGDELRRRDLLERLRQRGLAVAGRGRGRFDVLREAPEDVRDAQARAELAARLSALDADWRSYLEIDVPGRY